MVMGGAVTGALLLLLPGDGAGLLFLDDQRHWILSRPPSIRPFPFDPAARLRRANVYPRASRRYNPTGYGSGVRDPLVMGGAVTVRCCFFSQVMVRVCSFSTINELDSLASSQYPSIPLRPCCGFRTGLRLAMMHVSGVGTVSDLTSEYGP